MFAYVGGYTTPDRGGRGNGINVFRVDKRSGGWTHIQNLGGLENPSLFTLNRAGTRLYSVHGGRKLLSAFAIDHASGHLTLLNQIDCGGANPVDSALDPTERFLVVANYASGSVAVLPVGSEGELLPVSQSVVLPGSPGPDRKEQSSSHPHAVLFDPTGAFVVVPDKGFDRTFFFRFAGGRLTFTEQGWIAAAKGAAPRHAVFHPTLPILFVNNELDSTVTVYQWDSGVARELQVVGTLPNGHHGRNTTAEIAVSVDGRHLYVSNRGQDSIVYFEIAAEDGLLTYAATVPTGGMKPRFFTLSPDGTQLYVANQESDDITVFHVDRATGSLVENGMRIACESPSAISFVVATG